MTDESRAAWSAWQKRLMWTVAATATVLSAATSGVADAGGQPSADYVYTKCS